jgi:hypothetical protein
MTRLLWQLETRIGRAPLAFVLGGVLGAWIVIVVIVTLLMIALGRAPG